jgi:hypothetical protein
VVSCSNGTGSRHVSSFPRRWRRRPPRNRIRAAAEEEEEERRPRAPPLHRTRRLALHQLRVRRLLRRQPLRALRRRSPRRGTPLRKPPHHRDIALRRSRLRVPMGHRLPPRRGTVPRRPQRLPRNGSRKPADAATAIEDGFPNRHRARTRRSRAGRATLPPRRNPGAAVATPRNDETPLRSQG